jgi:polar amino acid transport system ATP-binding protein
MKLDIHNVNRSFEARKALCGASLSLEDVRSLVLIGPSGGGKSTLLRIIAGLETPDSGTVAINGKSVAFDERSLLLHRRNIGVVFQAFNLFPHLTALENLLLPLTVAHGQTKAQAQDAALQILSRFGLEGHANQKPASLSGGQKQRIAIARALVTKPQLLLLDEPTSALDPEMTHEVLEMIKELRDQGRELILATHEMAFAKSAADQIAFVAEGRILESGKPSELFASPKSPQLRMFLSKEIHA